jgi:hypothetical protein
VPMYKKRHFFIFATILLFIPLGCKCSGQPDKAAKTALKPAAPADTADSAPVPKKPHTGSIGDFMWIQNAGGPGLDEVTGICHGRDGSVYISGHFYSPITFAAGQPNETQLISAGKQDMFVAKYHSDGRFAWAKSAGGIDWDAATDVVTLDDGAVAVIGYFGKGKDGGGDGPITFDRGLSTETTLRSVGRGDIFVAKYKRTAPFPLPELRGENMMTA